MFGGPKWRPVTRRLTLVAVVGLVTGVGATLWVPTVPAVEFDPPIESPGVRWAELAKLGESWSGAAGSDIRPSWIWQSGTVEAAGEPAPNAPRSADARRWRVVRRVVWGPVLRRCGLIGLALGVAFVAVIAWTAHERRIGTGRARIDGWTAAVGALLLAVATGAVLWVPSRVVEVSVAPNGDTLAVSPLHGREAAYGWTAPWQPRAPMLTAYGSLPPYRAVRLERRVDWSVFWVQVAAAALCVFGCWQAWVWRRSVLAARRP